MDIDTEKINLNSNEINQQREKLTEERQTLRKHQEKLKKKSYEFQSKLSTYFKKIKQNEKIEENITDQNKRYVRQMMLIDELHKNNELETIQFKAEIEELNIDMKKLNEQVTKENAILIKKRKEQFRKIYYFNTNKIIPETLLDNLLNQISNLDEELGKERREYFENERRLNETENVLKSKEELIEGLNMIDFEQLKIENQTYNEKIEERNEEILKLKKKIKNNIEIITHCKEKFDFLNKLINERNNEFTNVMTTLSDKREILSKLKQERDKLRIKNQQIKSSYGLLENISLIKNYENCDDKVKILDEQIDNYKLAQSNATIDIKRFSMMIKKIKS